MRVLALACSAMVLALPASAQDAELAIELLAGHPIYHESEREAGVAMALSITPDDRQATSLMDLCEQLRLAAGLGDEQDDLRLETIFVVPRKGMAIEGYYWPEDGAEGRSRLVSGSSIGRATLDAIVARAGVPPLVLDQTEVEHEISCQIGEPLWHVAWLDVRPIGDADPDAVIERARRRFMAIHQTVVGHASEEPFRRTAQHASSLDRASPTPVRPISRPVGR